MLKVISFNICPFVQRVTALLAAKGIDYEIENISLKDKPQWFLENSPNGQVPVLITETGQALFESCCDLELDRQGNVIDYQTKAGACERC